MYKYYLQPPPASVLTLTRHRCSPKCATRLNTNVYFLCRKTCPRTALKLAWSDNLSARDGMILATSALSDAKSRSKVSQSPGTILPGLPLTPQAVEPLSAAPCAQPRELPSDAYIDRILQSGPQDFLLSHEPFVVKVSVA